MSSSIQGPFSHYLYREEECRVVSSQGDDGQMITYLVHADSGDAIAKFTGTLTEKQVFEALLFANASYAEAYDKGFLDGRVELGNQLLSSAEAMKNEILEKTRLEMGKRK